MASNKQAGYAGYRDGDTFYPLALLNLSATNNIETEDSLGTPYLSVGPLQVLGTVETSNSWSFDVEMEWITPETIPFIFYGYSKGTVTSLSLPRLPQSARTVPASPGPYTFTVTGLVEDQADVCVDVFESDGQITKLERVAAIGAPGDGQFTVSADTLTFNAAQAGASFTYYARQSLTIANDAIGGTSVLSQISSFEVFLAYGLTIGDARFVWFPNCSFSSGGEIPFVGTDSISKTINAGLPAGWTLPFADVPLAQILDT